MIDTAMDIQHAAPVLTTLNGIKILISLFNSADADVSPVSAISTGMYCPYLLAEAEWESSRSFSHQASPGTNDL
jgi:hypothetical protein